METAGGEVAGGSTQSARAGGRVQQMLPPPAPPPGRMQQKVCPPPCPLPSPRPTPHAPLLPPPLGSCGANWGVCGGVSHCAAVLRLCGDARAAPPYCHPRTPLPLAPSPRHNAAPPRPPPRSPTLQTVDMFALCNGVLCGFVAVTAGAHVLEPWAALLCGGTSALIFNLACAALLRLWVRKGRSLRNWVCPPAAWPGGQQRAALATAAAAPPLPLMIRCNAQAGSFTAIAMQEDDPTGVATPDI